MAQRPGIFRIGRIHIQPAERAATVRTGPKTAASARFTAWAELRNPDVVVALSIRLETGAVPVIEELLIQPGPKGTPVTATVLRGILVDRIVRAAIKAAGKPVTARADVAPGAFQVQGEPPGNQVYVSPAPGAGERVHQVARIYREALTAGSRAPAAAVAEELGYHRGHVARLVRQARAAGLLPPVAEVVKGRVSPPISAARDSGSEQPVIRVRRMTDPSSWGPERLPGEGI